MPFFAVYPYFSISPQVKERLVFHMHSLHSPSGIGQFHHAYSHSMIYWDTLRSKLLSCDCKNYYSTYIGMGDVEIKIIFIGESPGNCLN
jgi:hypothetical protein